MGPYFKLQAPCVQHQNERGHEEEESGNQQRTEEGDIREKPLSLPSTSVENIILQVKVPQKIACRLKHFYKEWLKVVHNRNVLKWIKGIKIPFCIQPKQKIIPSKTISPSDIKLYEKEIFNLLKKGAITKCKNSNNQFLSSYFLIKKPNGKNRFIFNLKKLNCFIPTNHFKLDDYRTAIRLITKDCYLANLDLQDAYFLLSIHKNHRKYLRFKFKNQLFEFNCLPFGINIAPYIFTKLMKEVARHLRILGCKVLIYLDDILIIGESHDQCYESIHTTVNLLTSLGMVINYEKSVLKPARKIQFLGYIFDSHELTIGLPADKIKSLLKLLNKTRNKKVIRIRAFASLVGKLVSISPAINYGWFHTKPFEIVKITNLRRNNMNYNKKMIIPEELKKEFGWWLKNITNEGKNFSPRVFTLEIFSDASMTGWGAYCNGQTARGFWNNDDSKRHINYLELKAAYYSLKSFSKTACSCNVLLRIDNMTAIATINRMGSIKFTQLNNMAKILWNYCEIKNIFIYASYINTKENIEADFLSRVTSTETEYELNQEAFTQIIHQLGKPHIDLFASKLNKKCDKYFSWGPDPDSLLVDAFTTSWTNLKFYGFPPFSLIHKVLEKIRTDKATGILVVPNWPSQSWFPFFQDLLIEEPIFFPPHDYLIYSPYREKHPLYKTLSLVAGKLSGKRFRSET